MDAGVRLDEVFAARRDEGVVGGPRRGESARMAADRRRFDGDDWVEEMEKALPQSREGRGRYEAFGRSGSGQAAVGAALYFVAPWVASGW